MSSWKKTGSVTVVRAPRKPMPQVTNTDRGKSSWESVRAYVPEPLVDGARKESHANRMRRLANRRDKCPVCGAITGERCLDLFALPAKTFLRGFHAKRKLLTQAPRVTAMTRLPKADAECACGGAAEQHKLRTGWCYHCKGKCRKFVAP